MQHRRLVESEVDERREQKRASKEGDPRKKMAAAAAMAMKDPSLWHKVAAISGVAALGLGTYGAHMFRPKNPAYKEVLGLLPGVHPCRIIRSISDLFVTIY